eukprot:gnl/TRDRNA2_/TRDRNA2_189246_c0_seq1.p1 gnl/TRDRNA2_/TRDRNA2_189246_c0~~gnl/TRDRNA2_/TRDRNA2_189246_c0_seq1.p1  ORF type:complete len:271 (+),score=63.20 gnl/TRDRNA2_/TRDRNA2_189246_c0_seq1:58-870(+)
MFGQAAAGPQNEAQLLCVEVAKRMEEMNSNVERGFVAYTYSFSDNPQILQQANSGQFNPAVHLDYAKWAQAVQNNPDPRSCYPEPLRGLPALEARINVQQRNQEDSVRLLEELRGGFSNLKDHLESQSLQKLEECRQRHQNLSRQLLQVVAAVEQYAVLNGAARQSPHLEAQLEENLARLEEVVSAPASTRARLEELWVVLRGLLQRGPPTGGALKMSDAEAERTLQLTASQGELLESLQEELARRKRDITQFENALARFAAAPIAPQTI